MGDNFGNVYGACILKNISAYVKINKNIYVTCIYIYIYIPESSKGVKFVPLNHQNRPFGVEI